MVLNDGGRSKNKRVLCQQAFTRQKYAFCLLVGSTVGWLVKLAAMQRESIVPVLVPTYSTKQLIPESVGPTRNEARDERERTRAIHSCQDQMINERDDDR